MGAPTSLPLILVPGRLLALPQQLPVGTFTPAPSVACGTFPWTLASADFDGDGHTDVVTTDHDGSGLILFRGVGDGTFGMGQNTFLAVQPTTVAVADWNRDGIPDLAIGSWGPPGAVLVMRGNGDGTFGAPVAIDIGGPGPTTAIAPDLDGNGLPDLVIADVSTNAIIVVLNESK